MTIPVYDQYLAPMSRADLGMEPKPFIPAKCDKCGATRVHIDEAEYRRWQQQLDLSSARYNASRAEERAHG